MKHRKYMVSKKEIKTIEDRINSFKESLLSEQRKLEKYNSGFNYKIKSIITFLIILFIWVGFSTIVTIFTENLITLQSSIIWSLFEGALIGLVFASACWEFERRKYYNIIGYISWYKNEIKKYKKELLKIKLSFQKQG